MATRASLLASRLGEERLALEAQAAVKRTLPPILPRFSTHIELHRALMMAKRGGRDAGIAHARDVLAQLPRERLDVALRLRMREIESA